MKVVQDDLWFCDDCYVIAETGDASGLDYYYGEEEANARLKEIESGIEKFGQHLVSDNDSETGDGIEEFATRSCDCCGSALAGGRHRMAVLGEGEPDYSKMTDEDFRRILEDIVREEGTAILYVGDVYPELAEHFNNEVLSRWEREQVDE